MGSWCINQNAICFFDSHTLFIWKHTEIGVNISEIYNTLGLSEYISILIGWLLVYLNFYFISKLFSKIGCLTVNWMGTFSKI